MDRQTLRILHRIDLASRAGNSDCRQFRHFLDETLANASIRNFVADPLGSLSPEAPSVLPLLSEPARDLNRWFGMPVPAWPCRLKEARRRSQARAWHVNTVLNWNLFGTAEPARLARELKGRSVYWEHGAAWRRFESPIDADFADGYDVYVAPSEAARQMLIQRWGVRREIRVCPPSPTSLPVTVRRHAWSLNKNRPVRIGFAGRLNATGGGLLAIHALKWLLSRGVEAELWLSGDGPDLVRLQMRTAYAGLASRVRFLGRRESADRFFSEIDLLLHSAIREPDGSVCMQALAAGVPVVATRVDALPELIESGRNGYCVTPSLPLDRYSEFGGDSQRVHPLVYRPECGAVAEPSLPAPDELGRAMLKVLSDPRRYALFSASAAEGFRRLARTGDTVSSLLSALRGEPMAQPDAAQRRTEAASAAGISMR